MFFIHMEFRLGPNGWLTQPLLQFETTSNRRFCFLTNRQPEPEKALDFKAGITDGAPVQTGASIMCRALAPWRGRESGRVSALSFFCAHIRPFC